MNYPETKREEISEVLHGITVHDPYRWLEKFDDSEVQNWLNKEHEYYHKTMNQIPNYKKSKNRIKEFLSLGFIGVPEKKDNLIFYQKQKTENQPILYVQDELTKVTKELVNPNKLAKENPVALDWFYISPKAKYLVYGLSESGDEWSLLHIKDIKTGEILTDKIPRTRYCSLAWLDDESGFYYTRYVLPGTVPEGQENYIKHIYYHKIGTDWKEDSIIFGEGKDPTFHYSVNISDDQRYLIINIMKYTKNDLYLLDLQENNKLIEITANEDYLFNALIKDGFLWILTNKNHPRWIVYKTEVDKPSFENWEEVIKESNDIISQVLIAKEKIFIKIMRNASDHIIVFTKDGEKIKELDLLLYSTITEMDTAARINVVKENEFFIGLRSFLEPNIIYRYEINNDKLTIFEKIKSPIKPENFEIKQVWYESKDGTKVSLFLAHKKGLKLDGNNPTLLCGYGGFNISVKPPYLKNSRFFWLENGGVIAIANLRGGSEYGENWHQDGMLGKKQNVYDDFIYAGKWLIENKYASNKTLSIYGRSNGGLLTGAAVTQAPEMFGAVYIGVPLLDMIRYHLFKIARYWIPEYGSSENPEQIGFIYNYSPYHNVKKGIKYPPTILVTAASDSRVDANHAMKMTAQMQWANESKEPIILFVERKAGHGVGKPLDQLVETETDLYTFLGWKTGLKM
ncbi:MAG TPA: prolyl oligopeptidase family serine peptidase [Candidatus Bathyarchaeia archaeon]|nr:prolyl oligopeptidase family serine peptidase [Candidatus Bathyarchaeia archaeon]